jgi:hypothetical protein
MLCVALPASAQGLQTSRTPGYNIGVEAGLAFPLGDFNNGVDTGYDFVGRFGYETSFGFTPQISVEYSLWSAKVAGVSFSPSALEIMPGIRWSFLGGGMRPWGAFNIGIGTLFPGCPSGTSCDSKNGLAYNVGGGVDFMITSATGLGLHLVFNHIDTSGAATQWLDLGAGLTSTF